MQVPPRILYWLQFLGGTTVGLAISWILFSQLRWKIFEPPTPETIKTEARISNGNSSRLPATREQTRLLGLERTYSFPAVRVTQIELATNGSLPNFFQLYTQSPTLRVPWLAAISSIFPNQAGHYQRLAADLQGDTASTSSVVASGLYFGTFANAGLHRSSLAELRGAFRAQLFWDKFYSKFRVFIFFVILYESNLCSFSYFLFLIFFEFSRFFCQYSFSDFDVFPIWHQELNLNLKKGLFDIP